jgi:protein-tyrosine phosphatase
MQAFDVIFFMEKANMDDAKMIAGAHWDASKAKLLLNEVHPDSNKAVPDPYYGTEPDYHDVFRLISDACDAFIAKHIS